ncbi:putative DENN domain-containing protein [Lupinus albus]|uniref:Putative DENN domain-containing protein n=1 Tax=Lupinus albus TaxID=3870 RepID=A0A6A4NFS5_LUPAL|nr:putative DENN domain-containing protein [Lupinus albus]
MLERSPSLSELNEFVYGQEHLGRDDLSFIFTLKVIAETHLCISSCLDQTTYNETLYGVCLHVPEIVQRPPGTLGTSYRHSHPSGCSRFLVSAPRCYCLLTRVPFFELHFEMLNRTHYALLGCSLVAQERLSRISQFVNELTLTGSIPSTSKLDDQMSSNANSPERELFNDWMSCAIPVDGAAAITAAAAGIIFDDKIPQLSPKIWDSHSQSPASVTASDASDFFPVRDIDKDGSKNQQNHDSCAFDIAETHDSTERMNWNYESDQLSPHVGTPFSTRSHVLERLGSFDSLFRCPARSMISEDEDDLFANNETDCGDELLMEWAMEKKNDFLQIVCRYHASPIPPRGSEFIFRPLEHLQAIQYIRHSVPSLGFSENCLNCSEPAKVNAKLADAEEALALSVWTTATTCRVLSLESVLALVSGVLLEKQVVVVCPNLGVLSATVLSLVPMIRPFQWQSLLLPVLPRKMIDFLDAPVPYIVGIPHKPGDLNMKTSNLVLVDVLKNQVKMCNLPKLPQYRELVSQLGPIHARLKCESSIARNNPVHRCNEVQADAATRFLNIMWHYLESLCSELKLHTITSVESNNDRVSLLLKDSFIDSFPNRDQAFMKVFIDTQLFTVLSDAHLSSFESGKS